MSQRKLKRIIAREGLIILVLIATLVISFILWLQVGSLISSTRPKDVDWAKTRQQGQSTGSLTKCGSDSECSKIDEACVGAQYNSRTYKYEGGYCVKQTNLIFLRPAQVLLQWLLIISLVFYPLYLIGRFILWAIKTLKSQNA